MPTIQRHPNGYCIGDHVLKVGDVVELRIYDEFRRGRVVNDPELAGLGVVFEGGGACGLVEGFVARLISAQGTSAARESLGGDSDTAARSHPKLLAAQETHRSRAR
jgi:hypothetical protein